MARLILLLCALCTLLISALAASPPSFCKCTCFTNSTIIPLSSRTSPDFGPPHLDVRAPGRTCADCDRNFCLEQRLPICHNAEAKDVFTTCFQRDSRKDQIVVLTFIAGTVGLLGWAAVRKLLEKRKQMNEGEPQQGYIAVGRLQHYVTAAGQQRQEVLLSSLSGHDQFIENWIEIARDEFQVGPKTRDRRTAR